MTDEFDTALRECLDETHNERYRHLASDANTLAAPNSAADYRRWILDRGWRRGAPEVPVNYTPVIPFPGTGCCP